MWKKSYVVVLIIFLTLFGCEEATSPEKLKEPLNFTSTQLGYESIKLSWEDNNDEITGFIIDRKTNEESWINDYIVLQDSLSTFIDSNLVEMGNYSYRIYAVNEEETSDYAETSLVFSYDDVVDIAVTGNEETELYPLTERNLQLQLLDAAANLVEREFEVWFTMLQAPEGVMINHTVVGESDTLSLFSSGGLLDINITAGSQEGLVELKTWVKNSVGNEIQTNIELAIDYNHPEVTDISLLNDEEIILESSEERRVFLILKDEFGNPVQDDYEVWIKLLSAPNGTTVNDELSSPDDSLAVWSSNGIATILLEAGITQGEVTLEVYTFNSENEEISYQIFATVDNQYPDVAELVLVNEDPIVLII